MLFLYERVIYKSTVLWRYVFGLGIDRRLDENDQIRVGASEREIRVNVLNLLFKLLTLLVLIIFF
jgi:hypothetical protein